MIIRHTHASRCITNDVSGTGGVVLSHCSFRIQIFSRILPLWQWHNAIHLFRDELEHFLIFSPMVWAFNHVIDTTGGKAQDRSTHVWNANVPGPTTTNLCHTSLWCVLNAREWYFLTGSNRWQHLGRRRYLFTTFFPYILCFTSLLLIVLSFCCLSIIKSLWGQLVFDGI